MLAGGTLVFNEIIVIPFLGFDTYTAEAIAKRKNQDSTATQDENYVGLSPHAAYDSKRNQRGLNENNLNATTEAGQTELDGQDEYMLKGK